MYGNFNIAINDIVVFSLINIAFYSILKERKFKNMDIFLFILCSIVIEIFVGFPFLLGFVTLFIPLVLISYFINNLNLALILKSLIIFLLSFILICFIEQTIFLRLLNFQYLISILILIIINFGLYKYGKE
tara:strand:+ start:254 stop:646 length:393 start_codon:yes stop_codon:yes gene_type:complete